MTAPESAGTGIILTVGTDFVVTATDLGNNGPNDGVLEVKCANEAKQISFVAVKGMTFFAPTGSYLVVCNTTDGRTVPVTASINVRRKV
jgi:hypothetical protein